MTTWEQVAACWKESDDPDDFDVAVLEEVLPGGKDDACLRDGVDGSLADAGGLERSCLATSDAAALSAIRMSTTTAVNMANWHKCGFAEFRLLESQC